VYDQEDTIEELWERVAKGMIGPPKIHAESQTRKEDVAEAAVTTVNVNTGGRTVEAQPGNPQHQASKGRKAKGRRNKAAWRKAEAAVKTAAADNEQPTLADANDPGPSLSGGTSNISTANSAFLAEQQAPTTRGPRWACPVNDHAEHTLAQCVDFWGAADCVSRRRLLSQAGCVTCLGRDQGSITSGTSPRGSIPRTGPGGSIPRTGPGGSNPHTGLDSPEYVPGQLRKTAPDDLMLLDPGEGSPSTREVQAFPSEQNGGGGGAHSF
jgi:hypothetical protein